MDIKQIRQQAQSETTASEILTKLANSKDGLTRQYVASNPNTPLKVLKKLSREFPEEIRANPIIDLLSLENPHYVSTLIQLLQARSSETPVETLIRLSISDNLDICEAVASNINTPSNVLNSLITRINNKPSRANVFCAIAKNANATVDILDKLIEACSSYIVYYAVLENPKTATKTLEKISVSQNLFPHPKLYSLIIKHPNKTPTIVHQAGFFQGKKDTPHYILEKFASHQDASIKNRVFQHPNVSNDFLHKLSLSPLKNVSKAVAEHPKTAGKTIYDLAIDDSENIRQTIARRQDIDKEIIDLLAKDSSEKVRCTIASNQSITENIINILAKDSSVKVRCTIACRPNTPPKIIYLLARDNSVKVRCATAENQDISEYIANTLAQDSSALVRCQLLNRYSIQGTSKYSRPLPRRNVSTYTLEILLAKSYENTCSELPYNTKYIELNSSEVFKQDYPAARYDVKTRECIASHPKATAEILDRLKSDRYDLVRKTVAKRKDISEKIANFLAKDSSEHVRCELAANRYISATTLRILLDNCYANNSDTIPTNARLNRDRLRTFGLGHEVVARQEIARHPQATEEILDRLKSDRYDYVRKAVADNFNTPKEILEQLKSDRSAIVCMAVANNRKLP